MYIYILIPIAILVFMGIKILPPRKASVVLRLGKTNRIIREGLNFTIPFIEWTRSQSLALMNLDVAVDGITEDNVKTTVWLNVIFRVKDDDQSIIDSIFKINDPIKTIRAMVEEQLRAKIFTFRHDDIFGKRNEIGDEVKETLAGKLHEFGMELDSVQVKDIQLDASVMEAMNNVVSAQKNKQAAITEAEGRKQGDILNAEADKEVKKLLGEGMALQREAIAKWFSQSIGEIKAQDKNLQWTQVLEFLLASSRIETLEKIGHNNAKVIYLNENLEGKMASMIHEE
jgi:regulator of protease activity HflC (stomatin/prohibitin superfamily)